MIDSSALIAILQDEPERPVLVRKLAQDPVRLISAANWLETAIVIDDRSARRVPATSSCS